MKLVALMSIEEHKPAIRKLLAMQGVALHSEMEMTGVRNISHPDERGNWFSHDTSEVYSHLFFAIVDEQKADAVMTAVAAYTAPMQHQNPPHAFQMDVEKFI